LRVGARLVEESGEGLRVGDVERVAADRAEFAELGDGGFQGGRVTVADDDTGSPPKEGFRGGPADSASGPGDDDRLAPDVVHAAELYTCRSCREAGDARGGWTR
jgi:hypothetical protein